MSSVNRSQGPLVHGRKRLKDLSQEHRFVRLSLEDVSSPADRDRTEENTEAILTMIEQHQGKDVLEVEMQVQETEEKKETKSTEDDAEG